jgi:hypothetical protein
VLVVFWAILPKLTTLLSARTTMEYQHRKKEKAAERTSEYPTMEQSKKDRKRLLERTQARRENKDESYNVAADSEEMLSRRDYQDVKNDAPEVTAGQQEKRLEEQKEETSGKETKGIASGHHVVETDVVVDAHLGIALDTPSVPEKDAGKIVEVVSDEQQATTKLAAEEVELASENTSTQSGAGGGKRRTEMKAPSLDGGLERIALQYELQKQQTSIYLQNGSEEKLKAGIQKIETLSTNEKKKESADEKIGHTQNAVTETAEEKLAEKKTEKVAQVDSLQAPEAKKEEVKGKLTESLSSHLPTTVEGVESFKQDGIAQRIGKEVRNTVEAKTNEIQSNYAQIEKTEKPSEPRKNIPLADLEQADPTDALSLGTDLIPAVEEASIDLSMYAEESDNLLKREGISEEKLAMVDSGDLAEANAMLGLVKEQVTQEPSNIRTEEQAEHNKVAKELGYHESLAKEKIEKERASGLNETRKGQVGTVDKMEDQKKQVTDKIEALYNTANTRVQEKLDKLKQQAFATFDKEEKAASSKFSDNVKRRIDKFKEERYDGTFGGLVEWWDNHLGDLNKNPEIKRILDEEKAAYIDTLNTSIGRIMEHSQNTIAECKAIINEARTQMDAYVSSLAPALQEVAKTAQEEFKKKLDELDEKVNQAAEELKKELELKKAQAIENIEKKIDAIKDSLKSTLSKVGDLLMDAALKFFEWALNAAGKNAEEIMPIIDKGKATLTAVVDDPIQFFNNLGAAVGQGISNFRDNIKEHLGGGFMTWMTGKMSALPIQLPEKFDLPGILSVAMQVLGLGWRTLRNKLAIKIGEEKMSRIETGAEIGLKVVTEVRDKGPIAMWDMAQDKAESIKNEVIDGGKNMATVEIVKQAIVRILAMLNPAGAVVQAILAIYNSVMFFVNNWQQVTAFVNSIFNSISSIARGSIGAAAKFVENSMAMAIPLILDFLARMLNLGSLADRIQKIIERVRKPIDQILDKIINWVINKVKKLFGKDKKKEKGSKEPGTELEDREVGERIEFVADGEVHHLWINTKGGIKVMVASTPSNFEDLIKRWKGKLSEFEEHSKEKTRAQKLLKHAKDAHAVTKNKAIQTDTLMNNEKRNAATPKEVKVSDDATEAAQHKLKNVLKQLFEIFGEVGAAYEKPEDIYEAHKDNIHKEAKNVVEASAAKVIEGENKKSEPQKKIKAWSGFTDKLKETPSTDSMFKEPLSEQFAYGKYFRSKMVSTGESNDKLKKLDKKEKTEAIEAQIASTKPGTHLHDALKSTIFKKDGEADVLSKIEAKFRGEDAHSDYNPVILSTKIENEEFILTYTYASEKEKSEDKQKIFTVRMKMLEGNKVQHSVTGTNLCLKNKGTRGRWESAGELAKEKYKGGDVQLNASHLIGDWFQGTGYKSGLNLIATSASFNLEDMLRTEKSIAQILVDEEINNPGKVATMNLHVTAIYSILSDDAVMEYLTNIGNVDSKKLHKQLQSKQDPRRCESVIYKITSLMLDGVKQQVEISEKKIGPDEKLDKIIK